MSRCVVPYWLSVVPDLAFPPQWGWSTGTGATASHTRTSLTFPAIKLGFDMTFQLNGADVQTVPEPASVVLLGLGLGGLRTREICQSDLSASSGLTRVARAAGK